MNFPKLNEWLTLIANLGVMFGLIVLIFELNQNTRVAKVSAYQALVDQASSYATIQINSSELTEAIDQARAGDGFESRRQGNVFDAFIRNIMRNADMAYFQYQNGLINEQQLYSVLGPLRGRLRDTELVRDMWCNSRGWSTYSAEFRLYIENMMSANGVEITCTN